MEKKNKRNNHMMNKGMKQKVSVLLILCLLLTGYHGLTISGKAEQSEKKESNEISVSGTEVKVQLHGEDLRKAAKEAIEKGDKVEENFLKGYSADGELQKEYEAVFSPEKEVYEIPLDSISEGLSESLSEEEAGLQIFVERDAKDLESLVRKESKESLLLYDGNSRIAQLFLEGKNEEKQDKTEKTKELTEGAIASSGETEETAVASDSNIKRNTELTGSELITFLYKNKSDHKISFKLSVDGNQYPKLAVAPKTQLFKALVEKLKQEGKKAQAEVKPAEKQEEKSIEKQEEKTKEEAVKTETSEEQKETSEETASVEEEKELSEKEKKSVSEVSIVSTEGKTEETQAEEKEPEEEKAEKNEEKKEEKKVETAEAETEEESAEKSEEAEKDGAKLTEVKKDSTKPAEAEKEVPETEKQSGEGKEAKEKAGVTGFLGEVLEHYEEFQGELLSARFSQYSLNELGRKSQNVEIEGFATVEVFYEEAAFDREVVLEAKRLFKPEEETEGEKLSEEQVKVLKEHSIYDDAASLDIRFVDKKDSTVEVEPKSPVSVRISIDKKALPAEVSSDAISIHHLVENDETKAIEKVEVVVQPSVLNSKEVLDSEETSGTLKTEEDKNDTITKEFVVDSFSLYQINWTDYAINYCPPIRFHYVDKNFNEIGPTVRVDINKKSDVVVRKDPPTTLYYKDEYGVWRRYNDQGEQYYTVYEGPGKTTFFNKEGKNYTGEAYKTFRGYEFLEAYPYKAGADNLDTIVNGHKNDYFDINYKYGPGDGDFRPGLKRIDSVGFTTARQDVPTTWYEKKRGWRGYVNCGTYDFYFVYDTTTKETKKRTEEDIETKQDKYIKDNQDGTYDLTLSAQVKKKTKPENLDIVFLVDTSKTMNMSFDTRNNIIGDIPSDKLAPAGTSRKELVQEYLSQMVTSLSKNSNYNLRFGLVGFGGGKTDDGTTISDTAFNDVTYLGGYTSSASEFNNMLANLPESEGSQTGPNYTAAIMGARRLIDESFIGNFDGADHVTSSSVGHDTNKIIVLIADNDPVYGYVLEDGVYDETRKTSGGLSDFTASLQKGYSYGNGVDFSRVALNQARGFLSNFNDNSYTAFYTIGIGNKDNWKHLKELTQAHGPSEFTGDDHRRWEDVPYTNSRKFIRAKSTLLEGADSKVFDGSTPESLKSSIIDLGQKIAPSATELTITDTLSENVKLVNDTELKAEIFKMKADGVNTDGKALTEPQRKELGLNGFKLEKPNPPLQQGGEIKLTTVPADFSLPAGYEIRLTATIKPSATAYEKLRKGEASKNTGGDRTDLQAIYHDEKINLPSDYSDKAVYGTSAGKQGLFTNDEAKFTYKWKGQDKGNCYNIPIITVKRADLKIEKTFVGLDKELVNNSSGVTEFGKKIVQQLKFDILRSEKKLGRTNPANSFLTIDFGDAKWAGALNDLEVSKNGKKEKVTIDGEDHEVTIRLINEANGEPKLSITVNDLDSEKYEYHVWEYIKGLENGKAEAVSDPNDPQGPKYRFIDGNIRQGPKTIGNTACGIFMFKNKYQKEEPKRTVTIKKIVNEFGGLSQQAKNDVFDFYMALYNGNEAYDEAKTKSFLDSLSANNQIVGKEEIKVKDQNGSIKEQWVIHFRLKHDESLSLTMDPNMYFRLFELKKEKYGKAIVTGEWSGQVHDCTAPALMEIDASTKYSYTEILSNMGQTITFQNPAKFTIPTGLTRDTTPYLLSIFGFVAMAGVYLTIRKKKRIEM